tara:strand:+ start:2367 stop:2564 length:198 start_codon:yes stop_codon:yes gene_type:complete
MATTIQISDGTKQILQKLKEQQHAANYDQVIGDLLRKSAKIPKSMFGTAKGMKWEKKDRLGFNEL